MSEDAHRKYAELLLEHFRAPRTLFVVSSDFCHWCDDAAAAAAADDDDDDGGGRGERFDYQPYDAGCACARARVHACARERLGAAHGAIHESIERLDRDALALIERGDARGFAAYLARTANTICGRVRACVRAAATAATAAAAAAVTAAT